MSRRFQFLFSSDWSNLGGNWAAKNSRPEGELIRRQRGSLEVLIQLLDRQLEIFPSRLEGGTLDQRDRAFQNRRSFF